MIIVGEGRKSNWVKEKIEEWDLTNVFLLGRHPIETMPLFFKQADVMLVSLKNEPVFALTVPAKIQAYMASAKIIVGMLNGEGQNLINESGAGYCVDSGAYGDLLEKIQEIQNLPLEKRKKMEQQAQVYYNTRFRKEILFDNLEATLKAGVNAIV